MTAHIAPTDLHVLDAEPRVQDLKLAEALEFSQPYDIRPLIKRNTTELSKYGELFGTVPKNGDPKGRGRPGQEYWLNEAQSVLVCMFSRTEKAAEVRREIIEVFMAWLRGHALPAPAAAPIGSTADSIDGQPLAVVNVKLGIVRESRLIHGPGRAAILWKRLGLPAVPGGSETAEAEARECLRHLLDHRVQTAHNEIPPFRPVRELLAHALDDRSFAAGWLKEIGLRVRTEGRPGLIVANTGAGVRAIFEGTRWQGDRHRPALRALPGAERIDKASKFEANTAHIATFIPLEVLDEFMDPPPAGGNVVAFEPAAGADR